MGRASAPGKRPVTLEQQKRRAAFLLITPACVVLVAVTVLPLFFGIYISFHDWALARPGGPKFAGLYNYESAFIFDDRFTNSMLVSLKFVVLAVSVEFTIGFAMAFAFHAKLRGLITLRKIAMLPIMVLPLATGLIWLYIFNQNFGMANGLLLLLGIDQVAWLTDVDLALISLVIADVWQWSPFIMLVIYAALQSLPEYVYEAAKMDGLSDWQAFWRITAPLLKPAVLVVVLIRSIDAFQTIELVFMMTKGGPAGTTEIMPYYIYLSAFQFLDLGYGAALAVVMILIIVVISQVFVRQLEE